MRASPMCSSVLFNECMHILAKLTLTVDAVLGDRAGWRLALGNLPPDLS
jgi:hypothetical protein